MLKEIKFFFIALLLLPALLFPQTAEISIVGGGGASVTGNNDWTGNNYFTSNGSPVQVRIYQTTNHTGTDWNGFYQSGAAVGGISMGSGGSGVFQVNPGGLRVDIPQGSAAAPAMTFNDGAGGNGIHGGTNGLGFGIATGGKERTFIVNVQRTLTEAVATSVIQVGIPSGSACGGTFEYTVVASDATDFQSRHGRTSFQVVNKAGVETCNMTATAETNDGSTLAQSGAATTLTYALTTDVTPVNGCNLQINATSSLVQTTLAASYRIDLDSSTLGTCTVTPQ